MPFHIIPHDLKNAVQDQPKYRTRQKKKREREREKERKKIK
jgi:hypothetical protein